MQGVFSIYFCSFLCYNWGDEKTREDFPMKSVKKMLLGIAFLIIASCGVPIWMAGADFGVILFLAGLLVGLVFCVDGFLSVD